MTTKLSNREKMTFDRIKGLIEEPPAVEEDSILFTSREDFSGNPKALFLYMVEQGIADRYRITWLFEKRENMIDFQMPNVSSIPMYEENGERAYEAYLAALTSKYLFYSHDINWLKLFREEQVFVDLWHGCGYKKDLNTDKVRIEYDYMTVVGRKFVDIFRRTMRNPDGEVVDLGYPRNELFFTDRSKATDYMDELKSSSQAKRAIIWMPTFRRSFRKDLDMDIEHGKTGLPIACDRDSILRLDEVCRANRVLLLIKKHPLQVDYDAEGEGLTNLVFLKNEDLNSRKIDLYEFIGKADALLTDYSSTAIDYMLVDRPMGFTMDDFDQYERARGWDLDNVRHYMPGNHILGMRDMETFIEEIAEGSDHHRDERNAVKNELHTYTDGFSRRIVDYFDI